MAKKNTALATYDDELAAFAAQYAEQEAGVGGGSFFSLRGGQLSLGGDPIPGNEMAVVILDAVLENVYYEGAYDPDEQGSPACFAFGRSEEAMAPHEQAVEPQHENCSGCPLNQFGSADTGRGKACKNRRRIAVLSAGTIDRNGDFEAFADAGDFTSGEIAYLGIPSTSLKGYAAYVKRLNATLKLPPFAVFTRIAVEPDPKNQFRVVFELLGRAPEKLVRTLMNRNKDAKDGIDFPYQPREDEVRKPAPKRKASKAATSNRTSRDAHPRRAAPGADVEETPRAPRRRKAAKY